EETKAIKRTFGEHAKKVAVSSTKSMTGHLLGGAGGLEAGICVLALRDQVIPPTANLENPDPECDLDYVPNKARKAKLEYVLTNSFGSGGTNGCLLSKRWTEKGRSAAVNPWASAQGERERIRLARRRPACTTTKKIAGKMPARRRRGRRCYFK